MICARTDSHQLKPFVPVILSSAPPNSTQLLPHTTMANHLYGQHQQKLPSSIYSAAKSAVYSTYLTDSSSSRLPSSSRYYSSSFSDSDRTPSTYLSSADAASTALWPSFDVSSIYTKRPTQAIYTQSSLGAHMLGQSEAWLSSDSLAKRPKLENACNLPVYPQRPGEKDCAHYMLTRTCRFGDSCKFDHPIWVPDGGIPDWKEMQLPPIPSEAHPERPGELDCPYFLKTQKCKFGLNCKFNHPKDKLSTLGKTDVADLPERPAEPLCSFYVKTGKCKFGTVCKFHHPKDIQIPSDGLEATNSEQAKSAGIGTLPSDRNFISDPTPSFNSKGLPIRLGEEDCPFYMKTGSCKYAANCRYNHPDRNAINPPAVVVGHSVLPSPIHNMTVGLVNPAAILQSFQPSLAQTTFGPGPVLYPQRPGQNECEYYIKTGICKFGEKCRFHHPVDRSSPKSVKLTLAGLPRREGVLNCPFYMKTGTCRYGATCRFDHPTPGEVIASAGREGSAEAEEEKEDGENTESSEE